MLLLNVAHKVRTGFTAMSLGTCNSSLCTEFLGQAVYFAAAIFQDVYVRRVSHFSIGAGGINLHLALVSGLLGTCSMRAPGRIILLV
ncbi:hypothetical protein EVA_11671 [gut metagenome]|uniref:Uncharacterized protein n=1 Tax=gut metagenome TaxID=749906 RepID=J9FZ17_9ZZZZ